MIRRTQFTATKETGGAKAVAREKNNVQRTTHSVQKSEEDVVLSCNPPWDVRWAFWRTLVTATALSGLRGTYH